MKRPIPILIVGLIFGAVLGVSIAIATKANGGVGHATRWPNPHPQWMERLCDSSHDTNCYYGHGIFGHGRSHYIRKFPDGAHCVFYVHHPRLDHCS